MDITFENISISSLAFLIGLSAGLCFTWSNAVTPGIGRLDNLGYLLSLQNMNRAIINPIFMVVFFGPFFLGIFNIYLFRNESISFIWLFTTGIAIYILGVVFVTIFGNVPLNELLEKVDLNGVSKAELKSLRDIIEVKWNRLHLIRTVSSSISFLILIICLIQFTKNNN